MDRTRGAIKEVLAGNREAYRDIVMQYQTMLLNYAGFLLPDRHLTEEAVHKTFIRAFTQLDRFQMDLDAWMKRANQLVEKRYITPDEADEAQKLILQGQLYVQRRRDPTEDHYRVSYLADVLLAKFGDQATGSPQRFEADS